MKSVAPENRIKLLLLTNFSMTQKFFLQLESSRKVGKYPMFVGFSLNWKVWDPFNTLINKLPSFNFFSLNA